MKRNFINYFFRILAIFCLAVLINFAFKLVGINLDHLLKHERIILFFILMTTGAIVREISMFSLIKKRKTKYVNILSPEYKFRAFLLSKIIFF